MRFIFIPLDLFCLKSARALSSKPIFSLNCVGITSICFICSGFDKRKTSHPLSEYPANTITSSSLERLIWNKPVSKLVKDSMLPSFILCLYKLEIPLLSDV